MGGLRFGIVGTGFIAGVIANSIAQAPNATLTAVSSRKRKTAEEFVAGHEYAVAVEGVSALFDRTDVDAVYVATPTAAKERIALGAMEAGKHALVDKPFVDHSSVERMTQAAASYNVVFMDATHFVHSPRNDAIRNAIPARIGTPRSLHTAFYFPFSERDNIRFDTQQEPMGALGDMAWYSMRALVEYLQPKGAVTSVSTAAEFDPESNSVVRVSGLIGFATGECSTFDICYTAGTVIMDLSLLGTVGIIQMDDFVLDWTNSFAFQNPGIHTGYLYRTGMATRSDFDYVETPSELSQDVLMVQNFAELVVDDTGHKRNAHVQATLKTQQYLDDLWADIQSR